MRDQLPTVHRTLTVPTTYCLPSPIKKGEEKEDGFFFSDLRRAGEGGGADSNSNSTPWGRNRSENFGVPHPPKEKEEDLSELS